MSDEESTALCLEALGALDQSVLTQLVRHAQGLPGALASAFYRLSSLSAVTPEDVEQLPAAEATLALTHARLLGVSEPGRRLLSSLALVSGVSRSLARRIVGEAQDEAEATLNALSEQGLLALTNEQLLLADAALRKALSESLGEQGRKQLAAALLNAPYSEQLSTIDRAGLATIALDTQRMRELIPAAAEALSHVGAHARAAELLEALQPCVDADLRDTTSLRLASTRHVLGQDAAAAQLANDVAERAAGATLRTEARLLAARALTALGQWDAAIAALRNVPGDAEAAQQAQVQRELAKIHLRRGDYTAVSSAVDTGLACAASDDPVRVELLCSRGIVASYAGDQAAAHSCYEQALALARARGVRSDEANVLTYLAIGCQRAGDMLGARDLLAQSLEIARELGDVGSMARFALNLGAIFYYLGEQAAAAEHYDSAARLSRRAGRSSTRLYARANLAHLHVYFGLYESARRQSEEVLAAAQTAGQRDTAAHLTISSADLAARTGDVEQALIRYDDGLARYATLGRTRELIEHNLDAAETLLNRAGPADASAAAVYT